MNFVIVACTVVSMRALPSWPAAAGAAGLRGRRACDTVQGTGGASRKTLAHNGVGGGGDCGTAETAAVGVRDRQIHARHRSAAPGGTATLDQYGGTVK
ncbi:MAG TPA: hypothetical protein VMN60_10695 [Longimicrobiales bacterium]|nr:hypothetical protein [Longimicrobiales bacterium]